jgi:DNA-binding MarR family transcriptional regulator
VIKDISTETPQLDIDADRPVTRIFRNVLRLSAFFNAVIDDTAKVHDLQRGEFLVLMTLYRMQAASGFSTAVRPTELFRSLLVTSGAVSKRLDKLEKMGLVGRQDCPDDARSSLVFVTPKGRLLAEKIRDTPNAMHGMADRLGDKQLAELDQALAAYVKILETSI